jgi:hypothetical protein
MEYPLYLIPGGSSPYLGDDEVFNGSLTHSYKVVHSLSR